MFRKTAKLTTNGRKEGKSYLFEYFANLKTESIDKIRRIKETFAFLVKSCFEKLRLLKYDQDVI